MRLLDAKLRDVINKTLERRLPLWRIFCQSSSSAGMRIERRDRTIDCGKRYRMVSRRFTLAYHTFSHTLWRDAHARFFYTLQREMRTRFYTLCGGKCAVLHILRRGENTHTNRRCRENGEVVSIGIILTGRLVCKINSGVYRSISSRDPR